MTQTKETTLAGVVGFFKDPTALLKAAKKAKEAKFPSFDAFTPFPVHGLDEAQGLKRSPIPFVTFIFGITGTTLAFLFQYWTSAVDWPINVGGKPFNSWPAFVPVMFEVTILFGGLSTVAALFFFCRLPNRKKPLIDPSVTRDRFALMIDAPTTEEEARNFLQGVGARDIKSIFEVNENAHSE